MRCPWRLGSSNDPASSARLTIVGSGFNRSLRKRRLQSDVPKTAGGIHRSETNAHCGERERPQAERNAATRGLYRPPDPERLAQEQMGKPVQALARWRSRNRDVSP